MKTSEAMKTQAKSEFDAWAGTYDRSLLNRFMFGPSYRMFLEELYAWRGQLSEPFDILDVGCGTGTFATMLAATKLPARIVGMDYSPAMCRTAADKTCRLPLKAPVRFLTGDSEHLPFRNASFDVVTCSNSFHHYPHQAVVVNEMFRVLRPGGRLMLIDGFRDNVIGWVVFDVIIAAVEKQIHHAPWSTISEYFTAAGFRDIRRRKFNFWFPLLLTVGTV
jgi:ubiquinone/menaquinone biosynthesis C-methylase UbiE